jgi:tetratricopeptide (TPR) repeat protein
VRRSVLIALSLLVSHGVVASDVRAQAPAAPPATAPAPAAQPAPAAETPAAAADPSRGNKMRDYHAALAQRRLGSQEPLNSNEVKERVAEAEDRLRIGRVDEAIAGLVALVEHPKFDAFAENEEGRAAIYLLGDALATAGAYDPGRAYLRRVLATKGAWEAGNATWARRAVRRLVEIAIESQRWSTGLADVKDVPSSAPEETRGEIAYLTGRAKEAAGDPEGAIVAYASVTQRSRFWAQATYLQGLIHVERGRYKEAENLFCKVADPNRQSKTTPVFADARYFAVRDLARLALGRVAHEQSRHDDARYYYYLVPRDSARLAEALYEAATTRYEKKDYDGARELLDELKAINVHHAYEDEAWILDAYVDLAQCKFPQADKKLVEFLARYQPVRDAARRIVSDERGLKALLTAARTGSDAGAVETGGATVSPEAMRAIAALVRVDPAYATVARKRAVLEHEASGLRFAIGQLSDLQKSLATNGGVRAAVDDRDTADEKRTRVEQELGGLRRQIEDLQASHAEPARMQGLEQELAALESRAQLQRGSGSGSLDASATAGKDLPDLLRSDAADGVALSPGIETARVELAQSESILAKDAVRRVDLRLSRLLRRARLGRIESVLGRKRALEVEIEAINNGILPASALDSLDAARYLEDHEEYWPFEGDDWPDEFVGGEGLK